MIKVNDTITLNSENLREAYPLYDQWFEAFNLFDIYERELYGDILEYHYNDHPDDSYICIWIAPHFSYIEKTLYAIQSKTTHKIFLVDESVIGDNTHTYSSYNPGKEAFQVMCNNYRKLMYDNVSLKDQCSKLLKQLETQSNPMPALENGMYGVMEIKGDSGVYNDTFVIYGGKIITLHGKVFDVDLFKNGYHENGYFDEHYHIVSLYGGSLLIMSMIFLNEFGNIIAENNT